MSRLKVRPEREASRPLKLHGARGVRERRGPEPGESVLELLAFAATIAAAVFGFVTARKYVRDRLKFVDAVQTLKAPIIAGLVAWAIAMPLTWLLPLVGAGTAISFGLSVAFGVRAGARDIRTDRRITAG